MLHGAAARSAARWPLASVWCVFFAVLHVYWALGGNIGLAESAGVDLASRRPLTFVLFGLWGVAALLLGGAVLGGVLVRARTRGMPRRLAIIAGGVIGTTLLVRGVGVELVLLLDLGGIASSVGPAQTHWSLLLWNPWFMLGGIAFVHGTCRLASLGRAEGPAP